MNQILNTTSTLVFIDAGVDNYHSLVDGVISTAEVFVLDKTADGIEQISQVLQQRQNIDAVHIISHGSPGTLYVGNTQLSLDTFKHYKNQLQKWDIRNLVLYGCNVAAGDAGEEFIAKLHALTGGEIAASKTLTGNAEKGGNWDLEVTVGEEKPVLAFQSSVMAAYEGVLTQTTNFEQANQFLYLKNPPALNLTFTDGTQSSINAGRSELVGFFPEFLPSQEPEISFPPGSSFTTDLPPIIGFYSFDVSSPLEIRSAFLFDIVSAGDKIVKSATFTGFNAENETFGTNESFELFDINESFIKNEISPFNLKPLHDDLITGKKYSVSPYVFNSINKPSPLINLILSTDAITDLNQAISNGDEKFGIGGAITTLEGLNLEETLPSNNTPTNITLSKNSIDENVDANSVISDFTTTDSDTNNTFTYALVDDFGDNSAFTIAENQLKINASPDYETKSSYSIKVKTTDSGGLEFVKEFTIDINDLDEPNIIEATQGKDKLQGTTGKDEINAGTGNDYLNGKAGDDELNGGADNDRVYGGEGNDTLDGGTGNDFLKAGTDNDVLSGGEGRDRLYGGDGDDSLTGGSGKDFLKGEDGNDTLIGANTTTFSVGERDRLYGGDGNDTFVLGNDSRAFYADNDSTTKGKRDYAFILDFETGDTIQLYGSAEDYTLDVSRGSTSIYLNNDDENGVGDLIGKIKGFEFENMDSEFSFAGGGATNDGNLNPV